MHYVLAAFLASFSGSLILPPDYPDVFQRLSELKVPDFGPLPKTVAIPSEITRIQELKPIDFDQHRVPESAAPIVQ
jgi:hypothetical protein